MVFLLVCGFSPQILLAASSYQGFYYEGSEDATTTRKYRINEYRRRSSELQNKIDELDSDVVLDVTMPVLFGVTLKNISPNFGDPRSGGRTHEGEDIMAVKGTPIVSPTDAVVIRVGTGDSEGKYVYTANPGGETFVYMHLNEIGENVESGTVLKKGDLIGYVGNTGNASGGAAHLHFEIHDDSNEPRDPFPRLSDEFDLDQKISYLEDILDKSNDEDDLAELLVLNFRSTFVSAQNQGIELPDAIINALKSISASAQAQGGAALPSGDLDVGSSGTLVISLQKYLISTGKGPARDSLADAGATGYFGLITKAALLEFQKKENITPANGYYGKSTREYIESHPLIAPEIIVPAEGTGNYGALILSRDLRIGMTGDDVRSLQKTLNKAGFIISTSGAGSLGFETTYFGQGTLASVVKFQLSKGIDPALGYVGPITRKAFSSL